MEKGRKEERSRYRRKEREGVERRWAGKTMKFSPLLINIHISFMLNVQKQISKDFRVVKVQITQNKCHPLF